MRKITKTVVSAFIARKSKSCGNTSTDGDVLRLHGNPIARFDLGGRIVVSLAGWPTVTTRERLNGLTELLGMGRGFHQAKGEQYLDGNPIDSDDWYPLTCSPEPVKIMPGLSCLSHQPVEPVVDCDGNL